MTKIIETAWIPMPDGIRLASRLWLPDEAERSPVPCILEYIPYRRRDRTRMRDESMHPHFADAGYAAVRVDMRGSGDSEGVMLDEYSEQELADGVDVIAWIADCATGAVGAAALQGLPAALAHPRRIRIRRRFWQSGSQAAGFPLERSCPPTSKGIWLISGTLRNTFPPGPDRQRTWKKARPARRIFAESAGSGTAAGLCGISCLRQ